MNLQCDISVSGTDECTPNPTLLTGQIDLKADGSFTFESLYEACFTQRQMHARGKFRRDAFPGGMHLEFLAESMSINQSEEIDFPRTIGSIDLESKSLTGVYTDLWSLPSEGDNRMLVVTCQRPAQADDVIKDLDL